MALWFVSYSRLFTIMNDIAEKVYQQNDGESNMQNFLKGWALRRHCELKVFLVNKGKRVRNSAIFYQVSPTIGFRVAHWKCELILQCLLLYLLNHCKYISSLYESKLTSRKYLIMINHKRELLKYCWHFNTFM